MSGLPMDGERHGKRPGARGLAPGRSRHTTFQVKVGLATPPEALRLGATVNGTLQMEAVPTIEIPASALTKFNGQPAVWIVDPNTLTVSTRNVDILRLDPATVTVSQGLDTGRHRGECRRAGAAPGAESSAARIGIMKQLNLSEWALSHRSLVIYIMLVAVAAGVFSDFRLGRNEDPTFIIKTMVVSAAWPGATVEDTLNQITEPTSAGARWRRPRISISLGATLRQAARRYSSSASRAARPRRSRRPGTTSAKASATSSTRCRPAR